MHENEGETTSPKEPESVLTDTSPSKLLRDMPEQLPCIPAEPPLRLLGIIRETYQNLLGECESLVLKIDNLSPQELQKVQNNFWDEEMDLFSDTMHSATNLLEKLNPYRERISKQNAKPLNHSRVSGMITWNYSAPIESKFDYLEEKIRNNHITKHHEKEHTWADVQQLHNHIAQHWDNIEPLRQALNPESPDEEAGDITREFNARLHQITISLEDKTRPLFLDLAEELTKNTTATLTVYTSIIEGLRKAINSLRDAQRARHTVDRARLSDLERVVSSLSQRNDPVMFATIIEAVNIPLLPEEIRNRLSLKLAEIKLIPPDIEIMQCRIQLLKIDNIRACRAEEDAAPLQQDLHTGLAGEPIRSTTIEAARMGAEYRKAGSRLSASTHKERTSRESEKAVQPAILVEQLTVSAHKLIQLLESKEKLEKTKQELLRSIGEPVTSATAATTMNVDDVEQHQQSPSCPKNLALTTLPHHQLLTKLGPGLKITPITNQGLYV